MAKSAKKVTKVIHKRKSVRFKPDLGTFAWIDTGAFTQTFKPEVVALVTEESSKGCRLLTFSDNEFEEGLRMKVKLGELAPLLSEVRWVKQLEEDVYHIGVMYLE